MEPAFLNVFAALAAKKERNCDSCHLVRRSKQSGVGGVGHLQLLDGRPVVFVARPADAQRAMPNPACTFARPDDLLSGSAHRDAQGRRHQGSSRRSPAGAVTASQASKRVANNVSAFL